MTMPRRSAGLTPTTPQGVGSRDHLSAVAAALSEDFADRLDAVSIERVATEELAAFAEARVRTSSRSWPSGAHDSDAGHGRRETWRRAHDPVTEVEGSPCLHTREKPAVRQKARMR
jgi:hypothetical protein